MKTRTMYMHTLDGKPASYDTRFGSYLYFVSGRNRVKLVPTLKQIRDEQFQAQTAASAYPSTDEWSDPSRYGYVLVEVPA